MNTTRDSDRVKEFRTNPELVTIFSLLTTSTDVDFFECGEDTLNMRIYHSIWSLDDDMNNIHCGDCTNLPCSCTLCQNLDAINQTEDMVTTCRETWTTLTDRELYRRIVANLLSIDPRSNDDFNQYTNIIYNKKAFTQIQSSDHASVADRVIQITRNGLYQDMAARKQWFVEHGCPSWG